MSEFAVKRVAAFWTVVNNGVMYAQRPTAPEAIAKAVALAAEAARLNGPTRVIYEKSDVEHQTIWDSEKDGFSAE